MPITGKKLVLVEILINRLLCMYGLYYEHGILYYKYYANNKASTYNTSIKISNNLEDILSFAGLDYDSIVKLNDIPLYDYIIDSKLFFGKIINTYILSNIKDRSIRNYIKDLYKYIVKRKLLDTDCLTPIDTLLIIKTIECNFKDCNLSKKVKEYEAGLNRKDNSDYMLYKKYFNISALKDNLTDYDDAKIGSIMSSYYHHVKEKNISNGYFNFTNYIRYTVNRDGSLLPELKEFIENNNITPF